MNAMPHPAAIHMLNLCNPEMNDYALHIYAGFALVGTLTLEPQTRTFALVYDSDWRTRPDSFALSPHLPLSAPATSDAIRRFLENLLPEGRALDVASVYSNIQKNNIFALVRFLGQETTGALSFLPFGQSPQVLMPSRRAVPLVELQERINTRQQLPFSVWDGKVRMSVAGYQDKLLVQWDQGQIFLANGALASTHILKPEPLNPQMPFMVANEHFCMQLMRRICQRRYAQNWVAEVEILRVPAAVLRIKRFDRTRTAQGVARHHIVDGCQALDMNVDAKYERNFGSGKDVRHIRDGVSFARLMAVRNHFEAPALGVQKLVFWALSTLLLGNSDAHGKNISFYMRKAGLEVAELYDLVSVVQYDTQTFEHDLAMAFGDEFSLPGIGAYALADFCISSGIPRAFFGRELAALCKLALEEAPAQALEAAYQDGERSFVAQMAAFVVDRANLLLRIAPEISKFKHDAF